MVEGARLESVYAGNRIAGSNPASSAISNSRRNKQYFQLVASSPKRRYPSHYTPHASAPYGPDAGLWSWWSVSPRMSVLWVFLPPPSSPQGADLRQTSMQVSGW